MSVLLNGSLKQAKKLRFYDSLYATHQTNLIGHQFEESFYGGSVYNFDTGPNEIRQNDFYAYSNFHSPGCPNALLFMNRKWTYSINTQVVCDMQGKILNIVTRWPGSAPCQKSTRADREIDIIDLFQSSKFTLSLYG